MVAYLIKHIVTTAIIELRLRCMTTIIFTLQFLIYRTIHALHATALDKKFWAFIKSCISIIWSVASWGQVAARSWGAAPSYDGHSLSGWLWWREVSRPEQRNETFIKTAAWLHVIHISQHQTCQAVCLHRSYQWIYFLRTSKIIAKFRWIQLLTTCFTKHLDRFLV